MILNIMSLAVLGRRYRCSGGRIMFSILRRKFLGDLAKLSSAGQRAFGGVWGRGRRTKVESLPEERRYSRQRQLK